jgi:hypothetical protein
MLDDPRRPTHEREQLWREWSTNRANHDRDDQREAIACTAARAAPSGFCSPMRRAIIAIAPMLKPIASA